MSLDASHREIDLGHRRHPMEELHGHPCNRCVTGFCSFKAIRVNADKRVDSVCSPYLLGFGDFRNSSQRREIYHLDDL